MSGGDNKQLHIVTPTIKSTPISKVARFDVYLKLESLQIPGSFKIRGLGYLISKVCFNKKRYGTLRHNNRLDCKHGMV